MTIGDDGIASICMGKEHVGNPCENCGMLNVIRCEERDGQFDSMCILESGHKGKHEFNPILQDSAGYPQRMTAESLAYQRESER